MDADISVGAYDEEDDRICAGCGHGYREGTETFPGRTIYFGWHDSVKLCFKCLAALSVQILNNGPMEAT